MVSAARMEQLVGVTGVVFKYHRNAANTTAVLACTQTAPKLVASPFSREAFNPKEALSPKTMHFGFILLISNVQGHENHLEIMKRDAAASPKVKPLFTDGR